MSRTTVYICTIKGEQQLVDLQDNYFRRKQGRKTVEGSVANCLYKIIVSKGIGEWVTG